MIFEPRELLFGYKPEMKTKAIAKIKNMKEQLEIANAYTPEMAKSLRNMIRTLYKAERLITQKAQEAYDYEKEIFRKSAL